jgi:threonine dehydratase
VIGASSGNHAQALALAGRLLAVPVTVVVPSDAPGAKVNGARSLGARVITYDRYRDDRDEIASGLAAEHEYALVPSADDPSVMAGAGTVALELPRQAPSLALILVPVGGAPLPWEVNKVLLDDVVTVPDDGIVQAMRWAFEYLKIAVEPSGAVALAALATSGLPAGPAGVVISGGSVDFGTFRALMAGLPDAKDRAVA